MKKTQLTAVLLSLLLLSEVTAAQTQMDMQWAKVQQRAKGAPIEVEPYEGPKVKGTITAVTADAITLSSGSAEKQFARVDIKRLRVPSLGKRLRNGFIGLFVGVGLGVAACPYCQNEGATDVASRNIGIGAALGGLAFFIPGSSTIYQGPKR
jgi:hypothetical protein